MVVRNVQGQSKVPVPLEPSALIVAFQRRLSIWWFRHASSGIALDLLLLALTVACNDNLEWARLLLFACRRGMTWLLARMATRLLRLATFLLTMLTGVFTLTRLVAGLSTSMRTTSECLFAHQTAECICTPTRLVLETLLPACTLLLGEKGAFWTLFIIWMAVVSDWWVPACC